MKHILLVSLCAWMVSAPVMAQVWTEDFEGDWTENWYASTGVWDIGVPTIGPTSVPDGSNCAGTNLTGSYPDGANTRLIRYTPFQVPVASTRPRMRFAHWFSSHGGDIGKVQIKTSNGDWTDLTDHTYSGSCSNSWTVEEVDLTPWSDSIATIGFLFSAGSSISGNPPGWYIDQVVILNDAISLADPEDFENGIGDWSVDRGSWQVGTPSVGVGPGSCHSGLFCAGTALAGNYDDGISTRIRTPWFILSGTSPSMTFWHWYSTNGGDLCEVQVRTPSGPWTTVSDQWSGNSAGWTFYFLDLGEYADSTIRIAFNLTAGSSISGNPAGWYVDDVDINNITNILSSVKENAEQVFQVWPNPFIGDLHLRLNIQGKLPVSIIDARGRLVANGSVSNNGPTTVNWRNASTNEPPPGIYFVTIIAQDGQRYTQRVVKQ